MKERSTQPFCAHVHGSKKYMSYTVEEPWESMVSSEVAVVKATVIPEPKRDGVVSATVRHLRMRISPAGPPDLAFSP